MKAIPEFDTDPFSRESVRNARAVDDRLREFAPVVKLPRENITMLGRHEHLREVVHGFEVRADPWLDAGARCRHGLGPR